MYSSNYCFLTCKRFLRRQIGWSGIPNTWRNFQFVVIHTVKFLVAHPLRILPAMQETQVQSLGWEDSLQKEMTTHSSILAWKIPWTEEPDRLQFMGLQSRTQLSNLTSLHTVKGFVIVNKAEIDVFLELSCFFHVPADVGNLISGSSAFSKTSLNREFMVHILLKPGLENFEHYFTSMWDECNCAVVWAFFGIAFLWDCYENWPFPVLW